MKELFNLSSDEISFEEASSYFGEKIPVTAEDFSKLSAKYKAFAFTVSGYTKAQILNKFHEELLKTIDEGSTIKTFKDNMNQFLEKYGYEGITNFQADNIYRTNIQTAFQSGHYEQMVKPEVMKYRPYWMYDAMNDQRTRRSHLAMDGRVFRADDPVWDIWYPPNGFRCRCSVITLSERQVKERNLVVEKGAPVAGELDGRFVNILPDPNFSTNAAKNRFIPTLNDVHEPIKKAYESQKTSNQK